MVNFGGFTVLNRVVTDDIISQTRSIQKYWYDVPDMLVSGKKLQIFVTMVNEGLAGKRTLYNM